MSNPSNPFDPYYYDEYVQGKKIRTDRDYLNAVSRHDDKIYWCNTCEKIHATLPCPKCKGEKKDVSERPQGE